MVKQMRGQHPATVGCQVLAAAAAIGGLLEPRAGPGQVTVAIGSADSCHCLAPPPPPPSLLPFARALAHPWASSSRHSVPNTEVPAHISNTPAPSYGYLLGQTGTSAARPGARESSIARSENMSWDALLPTLRLDTAAYTQSECTEATRKLCTRKTRITDVVYNASNNELVRTKTPVKNCMSKSPQGMASSMGSDRDDQEGEGTAPITLLLLPLLAAAAAGPQPSLRSAGPTPHLLVGGGNLGPGQLGMEPEPGPRCCLCGRGSTGTGPHHSLSCTTFAEGGMVLPSHCLCKRGCGTGPVALAQPAPPVRCQPTHFSHVAPALDPCSCCGFVWMDVQMDVRKTSL
ncbi:hypothetical protein QTO34_016833 [Cnephaeus nilssonii]|uniref:Uncharacterized protein n=1 Tax=Cnephaeus nilssonii TaxID=3371016 RepID=A0AA40I400_CNENI|nr:hypothetical protein QTO34_016833 [Eptesicus nilssonii]